MFGVLRLCVLHCVVHVHLQQPSASEVVLSVVDMFGFERHEVSITTHDTVLIHSYVINKLKYVRIQWNLSIEGTAGTQLAVLYREVSLMQR